MRQGPVGARVVICGALLWSCPLFAAAPGDPAAPPLPLGGVGHGVVTGLEGTAVASSIGGPAAKRPLNLGDVIQAGETVTVGKAGKLDILWDRRALVSVEEQSHVTVHESQRGQTQLRLQQGMARVSLSYSAGRMTDLFTLETPQAHVVTRGGVLEATVAGAEGRSFFAKLVNSAPAETIRVWEGQARIEPMLGDQKPLSMKAGSEVVLKSGAAGAVSEMPAGARSPASLAVREAHRNTPSPVTRQIVGAQVGQALELEKQLVQAPRTPPDKEPIAAGVKGTILPISAGVPTLPGGQPSTSLVTATAPSSQLPLSPGVQPGSVTTLGASQAGGLNSNALLQQILNNLVKANQDRGNSGKNSSKK